MERVGMNQVRYRLFDLVSNLICLNLSNKID